MIKSYYNEHSCARKYINKSITSGWIAEELAYKLKMDLEMKTKAMAAYIMEKYNVTVPYVSLYRAKKKARIANEGSHAESFGKLNHYGEVMRDRNPGSLFRLNFHQRQVFTEPPIFKRVFLCFKACINDFVRDCRPFIGLDGCHLKGVYGGVLLAAIAVDGNKGLFSIAYGVVESEGRESWQFFLTNLYAALHIYMDDMTITFMSDKQKGLHEAINETFVGHHHRCCSRHLYQNFNKRFSGVLLRRLFWSASKASNSFFFGKAMNDMKDKNKEAYDWLSKNPPNMWARHAFDFRCKSDHITNNMSESFNQWINHFRNKPILIVIDEIRKQLMSTMHKRYELGCTFKGIVTPKIKRKLDLLNEESRGCILRPAGLDEYEVSDRDGSYEVNLKNHTCGCRAWEGTGIPCKHATCCILYKRHTLESYCDDYYRVKRYLEAYKDIIHPLPGLEQLKSEHHLSTVQPPPLKRLPGRPHINRKKEPDEGASGEFRKRFGSIRCSNCKEVGHNSRKCKRAPIKGKEVKGKKGSGSKCDVNTSQRLTRSQASSTITYDNMQAKIEAQRKAKEDKRKAREMKKK
ncbi:uncharacterized protein LOC122639002 [Telopea speciosissima]|uniref:uncharacterized protein LOC122639002 n=1 Tax=Telopea speciosissima TaxID=54955 RepID=UPI001CC75F13|nr:uncharacterized protein LOC122639002 [Telopea speciosissima]